jgi:hypothetical protein
VNKYYLLKTSVEAIEITEKIFTDPHPNKDHVKFVIYDPILKQCAIPGSSEIGVIGDYIIRKSNGDLDFCTSISFHSNYAIIHDGNEGK